MGLMAGMLPGVEFARRRRLRAVGSSAEAPCAGTSRRTSLGLYGAGNGQGHAAAGFPKRSGVCEEMLAMQLDSNAREAKERLDQKLRSQRESVVMRRHSTGSLRLPIPSSSPRDRDAGNHQHPAKDATTVLQREVFTKKGGGRRFSWGLRKASPPATEQAECAVCLEEFRAGDVLAHLPCSHRFHWNCAVPWVQAASRCPFCRAAVRLAVD